MGAFEEDLLYKPIDYLNNHIPYVKESLVSKVLTYDQRGVEFAKEYAYSSVKPLNVSTLLIN